MRNYLPPMMRPLHLKRKVVKLVGDARGENGVKRLGVKKKA
jgi:hypothetical protein